MHEKQKKICKVKSKVARASASIPWIDQSSQRHFPYLENMRLFSSVRWCSASLENPLKTISPLQSEVYSMQHTPLGLRA